MSYTARYRVHGHQHAGYGRTDGDTADQGSGGCCGGEAWAERSGEDDQGHRAAPSADSGVDGVGVGRGSVQVI
jgi:hypothetical protein